MSIQNDINDALESYQKHLDKTLFFSSIGINLARNKKFKTLDASDVTKTSFSHLAKPKDVEAIKNQFCTCLINICLSEAIEGFDIFITKLCRLLETMMGHTKTINFEDSKCKIINKLGYLKQHIPQLMLKNDCIISIQHIRNCLTHRNGKVGKRDIKDRKQLELKWYYIKDEIRKNGSKVSIWSGFAKHTKKFKLGSEINILPNELHQIIVFMLDQSNEICFKTKQELGVLEKPMIVQLKKY